MRESEQNIRGTIFLCLVLSVLIYNLPNGRHNKCKYLVAVGHVDRVRNAKQTDRR